MNDGAGSKLVKERPYLFGGDHISNMVVHTSKLIACWIATRDMYGGPCFFFKQNFHNVETDKSTASNNKDTLFSHCIALSSNNQGAISSKNAVKQLRYCFGSSQEYEGMIGSSGGSEHWFACLVSQSYLINDISQWFYRHD